MKKKKDITLTTKDLSDQIVKAKIELIMHKTKNTNIVKNLHRDLARALTSERERELYAKV